MDIVDAQEPPPVDIVYEEEQPQEGAPGQGSNLAAGAAGLIGSLTAKLPEGVTEKLSSIPLPSTGEDSVLGKMGGFAKQGVSVAGPVVGEGFNKGKSFIFGATGGMFGMMKAEQPPNQEEQPPNQEEQPPNQ